MSFILQQIAANECYDIERRKRRLKKPQQAEAVQAWGAFDTARTAFALHRSRSNYNTLKAAGEAVVEMQTRLNIWLIHPANVGPGLRENDPRIIEE